MRFLHLTHAYPDLPNFSFFYSTVKVAVLPSELWLGLRRLSVPTSPLAFVLESNDLPFNTLTVT